MDDLENKKPLLEVHRPTGPRLTLSERASLGELVLSTAKNCTKKTLRFAVSFPSKYKVTTGLASSAVFALVMHLSVPSLHVIEAGTLLLMGAGNQPQVAATYQGPGDIVSGATVWASCARAYNAAYANGTNPLCDLVAVTGGAAVCTLRVATTGFVDLGGTYCAGTDPASACAAASGGSCKVTKAYDQTGAGNHFTQATLANMPALTFSSINGLPGIQCNSASATLANVNNFTQAQPFSMSTVAKNTSAASQGAIIGTLGINLFIGSGNANNTWGLQATTPLSTAAASDNAYHSGNALFNGASSNLNIDGSDNTVSPGTNGYSANGSRLCRGNATSEFTGTIMEAGIWLTTSFNSTQRGNLSTNQHSAVSGYNF